MARKHPWEEEYWLPGVLSDTQIKTLIKKKYIKGVKNPDKACGYSSFDLFLSDVGYKMKKGSIKPNGNKMYSEYLDDNKLAEKLIPNNGIYQLNKANCYVFKLKETIGDGLIKGNFYGQATPKSSIGRTDVIVRLIIDGMSQYDILNPHEIDKDATGEMFVEIIPISFNVQVKKGTPLTQLRLFYGNIDDAEIKNKKFTSSLLKGCHSENHLSVDLKNIEFDNEKICAFKAKSNNSKYVKLWEVDKTINYLDFWELISSENDTLIIDKDEFYILRSKERMYLPEEIAVYCRAMDETLGEMRIHYAGFVHPCFGKYRNDDKEGTPLIFEVRGHNINVLLNDNEKFAKLHFYRMSQQVKYKEPEIPEEDYGSQELKLSKYFNIKK